MNAALLPSLTRRTTHVLAYGVDVEYWYGVEKSNVKGGLQGMHMGWSFTSAAAPDLKIAIEHIREREDLEILLFRNDAKRPRQEVDADAKVLARALNAHPTKPWVVLGSGLEYLEPIFERAGIRVEQDMLEFAIHSRWEYRVEELDPTDRTG